VTILCCIFFSCWCFSFRPEQMNSSLEILDYESLYSSFRILCVVITSYSVTFILGIVGNLLVIWITGFKLKCISATWFLHLAVTDLICNIAVSLRIVDFIMSFSFLCRFSTPLIFFNMLTSVCFLTIISIDRCVSITCPMWSKIHRTPRSAKMISWITWTLCLIISVSYVTVSQMYFDISDCEYKLMLHLIGFSRSYQVVLIPKLVLLFIVPFLIISICSALVALKLKTLRRVGSEKPFKVITAVVFCFFICWCPYSIWPLIPIDGEDLATDFLVHEICICLAYFNSCINPILYICFSRDFKDRFTLRSLPARLKTVLNDGEETKNDTQTISKLTF
uniref:G-protein coupled receptors family 1 profile domain-containing protein n=1 Tax=Leptobrachium leishanense TaxID=445787 RepID=A0A8C5QAN1_9ANUR